MFYGCFVDECVKNVSGMPYMMFEDVQNNVTNVYYKLVGNRSSYLLVGAIINKPSLTHLKTASPKTSFFHDIS